MTPLYFLRRALLPALLLLWASANAVASDKGAELSVALDTASKLHLRLQTNPDGQISKTLDSPIRLQSGNYRVVPVIRSGLEIFVDGKPLEKHNRRAASGKSAREPTNLSVRLFGETIAEYRRSGGTWQTHSNPRLLSAFDLRQLEHRGKDYAKKWKENSSIDTQRRTLKTDLHTHFAGAIRSETIVEVAVEKNLRYPAALLDEMKLRYDPAKVKAGKIRVRDLNSKQRAKMASALRIETPDIKTFEGMERLYAYRSPLVKNPGLFGRYLEELAKDYKKTGVKYAEISLSQIVDPEWLREATKALPKIESTHGVQLRFVAAMWRYSPELYNLDLVERAKALSHNPYIVGVDFMGHETNSTRDFENVIKAAAEIRNLPGNGHFQVRVHAAENAYYPENARVAIEAGATRIGHGIYGDSATTQLAIKKGVLTEFNLGSNLSLNNVQTVPPILLSLRAGAAGVLGSDGHGLYDTNPRSEIEAARTAGLGEVEFARIAQVEANYIAMQDRAFQAKVARPGWDVIDEGKLPEPRFSDSIWEAEGNKRKIAENEVRNALDVRGIKMVDKSDLATVFPNRTPIMISGASATTWKEMTSKQQRKVKKTLRKLLSNVDPKKVYLVTGGTDYGVEKLVHHMVREMKLNIPVLGTPVLENFATDTDEAGRPKRIADEIGPLTHATIVGDSWHQMMGPTIKHVNDRKGLVLFVDGGGVVADGIQAAYNAGGKFLLMKLGREGASDRMIPRFGKTAGGGSRVVTERSLLRRLPKALMKSNVHFRRMR